MKDKNINVSELGNIIRLLVSTCTMIYRMTLPACYISDKFYNWESNQIDILLMLFHSTEVLTFFCRGMKGKINILNKNNQFRYIP